MSISVRLYLTEEVPPNTLEEFGLTETTAPNLRGSAYTHRSGMSAVAISVQPYDWEPVVTDLGIDYRWVVSMSPMIEDFGAQIVLIVDIGVQLIRRIGGGGAFIIDGETILMTWSGKDVTINSESSYVAHVDFDDTFSVARMPLIWTSDTSE